MATNSAEYQRKYMEGYRKRQKERIIKANANYWNKKYEELNKPKEEKTVDVDGNEM